MEPEAEKLIAESQSVNIIDQEQYPSSADIQAMSVFAADLSFVFEQREQWLYIDCTNETWRICQRAHSRHNECQQMRVDG